MPMLARGGSSKCGRGRPTDPPTPPGLPQLFYDILGPVLSGASTIALGGNLATHENFYASTPLNVTWGPAPQTANGWHDYHYAQWLAAGSPGLPSAGAGYDVPRNMFAHYLMYRDDNPTLATKFYDHACVMAKAYVDLLATQDPPFGAQTPHLQVEGMTLYYLATNYALARTGLGLAADRHTESGFSLANLSNQHFEFCDSRERGRALTSVIMAWLVDAPTAHGGFGGSWLTQGNTLIPAMVDGFLSTLGYTPTATETVDDTPRINHPGTYRHRLHDYFEKVFQDALFNDALIEAYRLCTAVLSGSQRTAILNAVKANGDYAFRMWDAQNKCFPYLDASYNSGIAIESTGPSPDNNCQFLNYLGWLGWVTGDATWFTRGDAVLDGALNSVYYSANIQPSYCSTYIPKQYSEMYTPHNYAWYRQATPLATPAVPVNAAVPTISGTTSSGSVLTCSTGSWSNSPTSFAYQWIRHRKDDFPFSGGAAYLYTDGQPPVNVGTNANTYTLVAGDVGKKMRCVVTASNASGASVPAITAKTAVVT